MYTRCPHCHTLYRIQTKEIEAAQGQAHCFHCDQVFNALDNIQETETVTTDVDDNRPETTPHEQMIPTGSHTIFLSEAFEVTEERQESPTTADEPEPDPEPEPEPTEDEELLKDTEILVESPDEDLSLLLETDNLEPEPPAAEEEEPASTAEPPEQSPAADEQTEPDSNPPAPIEPGNQEQPLPFDIPEGLPDIEPSEEINPFSNPPADTAGKSRSRILWFLGSSLLLFLLLVQLTWFQREALMRDPKGQVLLDMVCQLADCRLPQPREPKRIKILDREIKTHPSEKGALLLQLTIVNRASFAQPFPLVELSLYNTEEQLIARRNFKPREYLKAGQDSSKLMPTNSSEYIELSLEDPGNKVTGFKFDFH
jgi:predicted Zn finger-like uncharacterized protein